MVRFPHPEALAIIDPRPLLDDAARLAARYGGGLLTCETLAAGIANGRASRHTAEELGVALHVLN